MRSSTVRRLPLGELDRKCYSQLGELQHVFKRKFGRDINATEKMNTD